MTPTPPLPDADVAAEIRRDLNLLYLEAGHVSHMKAVERLTIQFDRLAARVQEAERGRDVALAAGDIQK